MTRQDIRKKKVIQGRAWCFTLNNSTKPEEMNIIKESGEPDCLVLVVGQEIGENGTFHLQGYVRWKKNKKLSGARSFLPRAHWEARKGDEDQAITYCRKEGDMLVDVIKENEQGKRTDIHRAVEMLKMAGPRGVAENFPIEMVKYGAGFERLYSYLYKAPMFQERVIEWHYGPTGVGKTFGVLERAQKAEEAGERVYKHSGPWHFMGMYIDHTWVIFDDFRHGDTRPNDFLAICDKYAHTVAVKGSFKPWTPKRVIFTCPNPPSEELAGWGLLRGEEINQFLRRIDKIYWHQEDRVGIIK